MRKVVRVLMATICVAFASWAFVACGGNKPEPKTALDVPVIASKVYNGETQTASVPETPAIRLRQMRAERTSANIR